VPGAATRLGEEEHFMIRNLVRLLLTCACALVAQPSAFAQGDAIAVVTNALSSDVIHTKTFTWRGM
jgi:hypothetical protein